MIFGNDLGPQPDLGRGNQRLGGRPSGRFGPPIGQNPPIVNRLNGGPGARPDIRVGNQFITTQPAARVPGENPQGSQFIHGPTGTPDFQGSQQINQPASNSGGGGLGGKGKPPKQPTPFDAEYYANVANYLFKTNNAISGNLQSEALDRTALQGGLGQLQYAQPRAELSQMERANQMGALYSTPYAQSIGEIGNQYATKEGSLASQYGGKLSALAAQIAALRGSVPLYENSQGLASAARLAAAAAKNKALGEPKPKGPLPGHGGRSMNMNQHIRPGRVVSGGVRKGRGPRTQTILVPTDRVGRGGGGNYGGF